MKITIESQIVGGKNNLIVTRSGRRVPRAPWARWRDRTVREVRGQLPRGWKPITTPTGITLEYWAGDKRRRDMPAVLDAIFHILEKAGVVADDTLLWVTKSSRGYDKEAPRVELVIGGTSNIQHSVKENQQEQTEGTERDGGNIQHSTFNNQRRILK